MMNTPDKPGFYWARTASCDWYNLIVNVHGIPPFLRMEAWDRKDDRILTDAKPYLIAGWGPMICEETPIPVEDKKP